MSVNKNVRSENNLNAFPSEKDQIAGRVSNLIQTSFAKAQFQTKEEYILHLAEVKQIQRMENAPHDGLIHLQGHLVIDNTVVAGADWSDVICDSAKVVDGQIDHYSKLPCAKRGITTELKAADAKEYIKHNAYGAEFGKDGIRVKGVFHLPDTRNLPDLSTVTADWVLIHGQKAELSKLPRAKKDILNISMDNLIVDCEKPAVTGRNKGLRKSLCKELEGEKPGLNLFGRWFGREMKAEKNGNKL